MNKTIVNKAATITRRIGRKYGVKELLVTANESPLRKGELAMYVDGDIVDLYFNNDGYGWGFRNELDEAFDKAGLFVEPYTSTIFDIYKK